MNVEKQVAEILLDLKCVVFNFKDFFTYTSGMKSPIYTNCRLLISYPKEREQIAQWLAELIKSKVKIDKNTLICGSASAGIPHAAWVSEYLKIGMIYARDKQKEYGLCKIIEGKDIKKLPVIIVEDHITTGKSIVEEVKNIRNECGTVEYAFSIFSYNLEIAKEKLEQTNIKAFSLCNIDTLLDIAIERKDITKEQKDDVLRILGRK